jgi:hypothetical protein
VCQVDVWAWPPAHQIISDGHASSALQRTAQGCGAVFFILGAHGEQASSEVGIDGQPVDAWVWVAPRSWMRAESSSAVVCARSRVASRRPVPREDGRRDTT